MQQTKTTQNKMAHAKNTPEQNATQQMKGRTKFHTEKDSRTKCHSRNERPDKMPLGIAHLQACAEYISNKSSRRMK